MLDFVSFLSAGNGFGDGSGGDEQGCTGSGDVSNKGQASASAAAGRSAAAGASAARAAGGVQNGWGSPAPAPNINRSTKSVVGEKNVYGSTIFDSVVRANDDDITLTNKAKNDAKNIVTSRNREETCFNVFGIGCAEVDLLLVDVSF